jgi:hypothetical protein
VDNVEFARTANQLLNLEGAIGERVSHVHIPERSRGGRVQLSCGDGSTWSEDRHLVPALNEALGERVHAAFRSPAFLRGKLHEKRSHFRDPHRHSTSSDGLSTGRQRTAEEGVRSERAPRTGLLFSPTPPTNGPKHEEGPPRGGGPFAGETRSGRLGGQLLPAPLLEGLAAGLRADMDLHRLRP